MSIRFYRFTSQEIPPNFELQEITSNEEYKLLKQRVSNGKTYIEKRGGFLEPSLKIYTEFYEQMCVLCLDWEIKNDLLPF